MKQTSLLLLALITALFASGEVGAANSITLSATSSPMAGQIAGNGTYTLDMGYSLVDIFLFASPIGGGLGSKTQQGPDTKYLTWPIVTSNVTGLDANTTYNVWAVLTIKETITGNKFIYFSNNKQQKAGP